MSGTNCPLCGLLPSLQEHCGTCRAIYSPSRKNQRDLAQGRAHQAVYKAKKFGGLPQPATLACADCGEPASDYDHRDYDKPLMVEPVCRRCNIVRGQERSYPIDNSWAAREAERAGTTLVISP